MTHYWLLKGGAAPEKESGESGEASHEGVDERAIRCVACSAMLTFEQFGVEVDGAFEHRCMNPHGIFFRIQCYGSAPGVRGEGPKVGFWSWFKGYGWQVAECSSCACHVGWRFTKGATMFFGLIADELNHP